ncbi:MAG: ATP-binding protein [Comamonadaceae bacterium]|nr:MAG: ATP-binding protein [Comamonadaceae bacterium]
MSFASLPSRFRVARPVAAIALALVLGACATGPNFEAPANDFKGRISVVDTPVVVPGAEVKIAGQDFVPGQQVQLSYGGVALGAPATADADGKFRTAFTVPANAPAGQHPVVVSATKPLAALVHPLKVSPNVPLSGQDKFSLSSQKLVNGLYQAAYSTRSNSVFVTSAVGRPPVSQSELVKVNAQTLAIEARVTPAAAPAAAPAPGQQARAPGVFAVYGVGVDDSNGTVWVTNTRQNTVAVYRQANLQLVKQFEPGAAPHARDVLIDEARSKAFVSPVFHPAIKVFDTKTLQALPEIKIETTVKGRDAKDFSPMSIDLDRQAGKLYVVSGNAPEVAIIDTATAKVEKIFLVDGIKSPTGIGYDERSKRLFVTAQGSDNVAIVDPATGKTLHTVPVGAGSLNVAVDATRGLAYVPNRGAGTVTVVDTNGKIVGNLPGGTFPNHVTFDGKGSVFAVNKARGADDAQGDRITRITPR